MTAKLVRTRRLSGHEGPVAQVLEGVMNELSYREASVDRAGWLIGIVGPDAGAPKVLFNGHTDMIPGVGCPSVDLHSG